MRDWLIFRTGSVQSSPIGTLEKRTSPRTSSPKRSLQSPWVTTEWCDENIILCTTNLSYSQRYKGNIEHDRSKNERETINHKRHDQRHGLAREANSPLSMQSMWTSKQNGLCRCLTSQYRVSASNICREICTWLLRSRRWLAAPRCPSPTDRSLFPWRNPPQFSW